MDKLRALEYFLSAAKYSSLSAAAHAHGVSVQAVAKSIDALEAHVGVVLFVRSTRGLSLTKDGSRYAEQCAPSMEKLAAADEQMRQSRHRPTGTLVLGGTNFVIQQCLVPELQRFHASYPELALDIRSVMHLGDASAQECDVLLVQGWFDADQWVRRDLPTVRNFPVATPAYWAKHGMPNDPQELIAHACLCYRNPFGKLLDVWRFQQKERIEEVPVSSWVHSNHRNHLRDLALSSLGILRVSALVEHADLQNGTFVPALVDWLVLDSAPVSLYYAPSQREVAKVQIFVDFAAQCFARLAAAYEGASAVAPPRPEWYLSSGHSVSDWLGRKTT